MEGELLMLGFTPAGEKAPRCLDGSRLEARVCDGSAAQHWKLAADGMGMGGEAGTITTTSVSLGALHSGNETQCLTITL